MIPSKDTEEKRQHSTTLIPYSSYECHLPEAFMNVPMHWHNEFELNYILDGKGEFICGSQKFTARKGDVLILPPNMLHSAYPCKDNVLLYEALVFSPVLLGISSGDRCSVECIRPILNQNAQIHVHICPSSRGYDDMRIAVLEIFTCVQQNCPVADLLLKSELLKFFWLLETNELVSPCKDDASEYNDLLRPVLEYMARHFQEDITVEKLADMVHLSKSYFMRCFKETVGVGAIEHLTQLRITEACDALTSTRDNVSDIASYCGYSNLSNFNRQFQKRVGCSPNEYRKRNAYNNQISSM